MNLIEPLSGTALETTVGLTTTVPVELVYAAGLTPVDLNNIFVNSGAAGDLVIEAEKRGFPRNSCAWTKGVYATALRLGLKRVVAVVQGDCANSQAMAERLQDDGLSVIPFLFPYSPDDTEFLDMTLARFAVALGTTVAGAGEWKLRLDRIRKSAHRVDQLAWRENRVTGAEQHQWLVSCSDFLSDPAKYESEAAAFLTEAESRQPLPRALRIALLGVPPICSDFFTFLEQHGARVVFNEIPRQFAMPYAASSLREQYARYTYPYDVFHRLDDIRTELAQRSVDGVIHYVQSFCHRQIQDPIIRRALDRPMLTLEGDRPGPLDMPTETRLEAFLEMLQKKGA